MLRLNEFKYSLSLGVGDLYRNNNFFAIPAVGMALCDVRHCDVRHCKESAKIYLSTLEALRLSYNNDMLFMCYKHFNIALKEKIIYAFPKESFRFIQYD